MLELRRCIGIGATLVLIACAADGPRPNGHPTQLLPGEQLSTDATVKYLDLEGGCWLVQTASGARYEPVNLAKQYRQDGLRVQVVLQAAPDMASICMVAPLVRIDSIALK
jgi:hypothetical protein